MLTHSRLITFYDSNSTLFYLDPPSGNTKRSSYPVGDFTDIDYEDMCTLCKNIKGKFLLTINDDPLIKHSFTHFNIINVDEIYNISKITKEERIINN